MAVLPLPYTDALLSDVTVFELSCGGGDGTAIRGRAVGYVVYAGGGTGVVGTAEYGGTGVRGQVTGFDQVHSSGAGVFGTAEGGAGVFGWGTSSDFSGGTPGVIGESIEGIGVYGISHGGDKKQGGPAGVSGESEHGAGIYGISHQSGPVGIEGGPTPSGGAGVFGQCDEVSGIGVRGAASKGIGVYARSNSGYGVYAQSNFFPFEAYNPRSLNLVQLAGPGAAGFFDGYVYITSSLAVDGPIWKGGGGFRIDHPLAPAEKFLFHSFVESPDMKNIYDGITVLKANGEAVVTLPRWFQALNKDFRYQLTSVGSANSGLYISREIRRNRFTIAGGSPGSKVSWQVTGTRKDGWADANRIVVEQNKPRGQRGHYLTPEAFGKPASKGLKWAQSPRRRAQSPTAQEDKAPMPHESSGDMAGRIKRLHANPRNNRPTAMRGAAAKNLKK